MTIVERPVQPRQSVMEFAGGLSVNMVCWISALRPVEKPITKALVNDLAVVLKSIQCPLKYYDAESPALFLDALRKVSGAAKDGLRPILHLDMHGSKKHGLEIGATKQLVPWPAVVHELQAINKATGNNLCVVSASCFGFHAISQIKIAEACPFYLLIAPENEVTLGFLADHTVDFYRDVFLGGDIHTAFKAHLSGAMRVFSADKMLFISIARYIHNACRGKPAAQRRERLLSEILAAGKKRTPENLKAIRKTIKAGIRPTQELLDKYVEGFLVGKKPGFTFDNLLKYVESASRITPRT